MDQAGEGLQPQGENTLKNDNNLLMLYLLNNKSFSKVGVTDWSVGSPNMNLLKTVKSGKLTQIPKLPCNGTDRSKYNHLQ